MEYITCPFCGCEYHIAEIFLPNDVIKNIKYIERNNEGKITNIVPSDDCTKTQYICDKCNKLFEASLENMEFKTEKISEFPHITQLW